MKQELGGAKQTIIKAGETWNVPYENGKIKELMLILDDATVEITSETWENNLGVAVAATYISTIVLPASTVLPINASKIKVLTGTVMAW